ncbi:MAG: hypothetical protein Q9223_000152 [Gallowayella weberi]
MTVHHSTFDAIFMSAFIQDFDAILAGDSKQLMEHGPFQLYAGTYHLHKHGTAALENVRYRANRLKVVKAYTEALWPVQKGPEWLIGNDHRWTYRSGLPGGSHLRQHTYALLAALKQKHNLDASSIFKAAVTLSLQHKDDGTTTRTHLPRR